MSSSKQYRLLNASSRALTIVAGGCGFFVASDLCSLAIAQQPIGIVVAPADQVEGQPPAIPPTAIIAAEVQEGVMVAPGGAAVVIQPAPGAPAPPTADKPATPPKAGEAPGGAADKFNPQLIQNNPKAHAYAEQLRGPVLVQLGLLKRVVELTPEELAKCTAIAQDELFKVASDYAVRSGKISGSRYYPPPFNPETGEDVIGPLSASIRTAIEKSLPEEKRAKYAAAMKEQTQFRRDACLESLLCRIDICLVLSEQQRAEIAKSLDENWDSKWEETGAMQGIGHESFPNVPSKLLAPSLDEDQLASWESRHKDMNHSGVGMGSNVIPTDIPWDAERHR